MSGRSLCCAVARAAGVHVGIDAHGEPAARVLACRGEFVGCRTDVSQHLDVAIDSRGDLAQRGDHLLQITEGEIQRIADDRTGKRIRPSDGAWSRRKTSQVRRPESPRTDRGFRSRSPSGSFHPQ